MTMKRWIDNFDELKICNGLGHVVDLDGQQRKYDNMQQHGSITVAMESYTRQQQKIMINQWCMAAINKAKVLMVYEMEHKLDHDSIMQHK